MTRTVRQAAWKIEPDELLDEGTRMAVRDLLIAATARSTGDHLVVADADFQTDALESKPRVTNCRND